MKGHWTQVMGGSQCQVKYLLDNIVPTDQFEICYLTRNYDPQFHPKGYRIIKIADESGIGRYGSFFDVFKLLKLLQQIQPDTIYQRVGCAYTGIAAHYARRNNCKMVWHIASDRDAYPFQEQLSLRSITRYIDKKILEYGVRSSHYIIAQTNQQAEYLKKHYGRMPTKVIPNFHPLPRENIKKTNPAKIVWIANFKPLKQPEYFINLARDLSVLGEKVECVMIGAPARWDLGWQRSLENEIHEIGHLTYLGARPLEEVNSILAKAHILVNTSLYEGFANTFIQAWMRKVPVISLHVNPDGVLDQNEIGFFSGTYEKMLQRVVELIKNPALRDEMGKRAQAYAFEKHSEKNIANLIEILKN
ncbi:MAG: glycosyltransferase family 4 protein [Deltaproteobacteria bacterium]|jgi:glycosyltransferase involved in cell wall biosynthesis|nr:glycosyltransferase family 4 protein [Deltaproteobacteria bacterium]